MANFQAQIEPPNAAAGSTNAKTGLAAAVPIILAGDKTPPTVGPFSPTTGSPLSPQEPITFTVTDNIQLALVIVYAQFTDDAGETFKELVYDGAAFANQYANPFNTVTGTALIGLHFSVLRDGGWPYTTTLKVTAIDTSGNITS